MQPVHVQEVGSIAAQYKEAPQRIRDLIDGFIRQSQQELLSECLVNPYYNIPALVNQTCVLYYREKLRFTHFEPPIELSEDGLSCKLLSANAKAAYCDAEIDAAKYTKVHFNAVRIGYAKIGLHETADTSLVYFHNRLNSNGQVCDKARLTKGSDKARGYKTGDILTMVVRNNSMEILVNHKSVHRWQELYGKFKIGVGMHYKDDQVSIAEVEALNAKI